MKLHHLLILLVIFSFQYSDAAYVEKVKGKKVLIFLDGMSVNKGDMIETIDPMSKKKTAILRVTTVKDDKAIAQIVRGKSKINQTVQARTGKSSSKSAAHKSSDSDTDRDSKSSSKSDSTFAIGGMLGVRLDTMELKLPPYPAPLETVETTGMGFSLMGVADMDINDWFAFRVLAGLEQFNAKGDSKLGDGTTGSYCKTCDTEITYFKGSVLGKINVFSTVWLGAGLGLQVPISKKTNALDKESIKSEVVYIVGGGADVALTDSMYIPLQLEYGMTPSSDFVKASYFGIRAGLMLRY